MKAGMMKPGVHREGQPQQMTQKDLNIASVMAELSVARRDTQLTHLPSWMDLDQALVRLLPWEQQQHL